MYWNRCLVCLVLLVAVMRVPTARATERSVPDAFFVEDAELSGLIALLLEENPEILAARDLWRSMEQRVPQARALPDPRLSYRFFAETPETRVGPQRHGLEISQELPWFGKRALQAEREAHLADGSRWDLRDLERRLVAELKRAYFEAVYLREALRINDEETELLRRFEQIALTRYATGEGIQQSVVKVQTEVSRLADDRVRLKQRLDVLDRHVAHLLGRMEFDWQPAPGRLELKDVSADLEMLDHATVGAHPEARSLERRIEADETWARRRGLDARPDLTVGLDYVDVGKREDMPGIVNPPPDNGQDILALKVELNIPLQRKRIRAGVAEAELRASETRSHLEHIKHRLTFEVHEASLRVEALLERARLHEQVLLPQAEEALASSEAAYTTDRLDFLDLLDSERVLFQLRTAHQRLLADYWIALSDLERALGRRFPTPAGEDRS